jgi:membrane-associated phospholipid phosphatase
MRFLGYLKRLFSVDWIFIFYILLTTTFIFIFYLRIHHVAIMLVVRLGLVLFILFLPLMDRLIKYPVFQYFRIVYPLVFFTYFYAETDALNNVFFNNLDYTFARIDSLMFGFQPSLNFSQFFPERWFSELMNLGYFSYYFLILGLTIYVFIINNRDFERITFMIISSFLIYYILFSIIPVGGPQYYFKPPYNTIPDSGIFRKLVKIAESIGERPTAAFPSSHVGVILILIILAWKKYSKTLKWLIPFFILITFSTVYVKAHYVIDVFGGIISAPIVLYVSVLIWKLVGNTGLINSNIDSI